METTGLITREVKYGDRTRIITVITEDMGKVSAIVNKFRNGKSGNMPGLQLFSYSKLVLFQGGEKSLFRINEADIIEPFKNIREDLMGIVYASYFGDVANRVAVENESDREFLRLILNIFYALSEGNENFDKIKTVFEWKTAAAEGYAPSLDRCTLCGSGAISYIDMTRGVGLCEKCGKDFGGAARVNQGLVGAIKYICESDCARMLAFDISDKMVEYLNSLSEIYLGMHLDCKFKTLDYLKRMKNT